MTPNELGTWIQIAAWVTLLIGGVLGGLVAIKTLRAPERKMPQPMKIVNVEEFVARPEFARHREEVNERFVAATNARKRMHETNEQIGRELAKLQSTADHTSKEINQLRASAEAADIRHDKALENINTRIDHLPARFAEQLRLFTSRPS